MKKKYNIAIVGATGMVGETVLSVLAERHFPVGELFAFASEKSAGNTMLFKDKKIDVKKLETADFSKAQIVFFAAGTEVSLQYVPIAVKAGCKVIDKSSAFRCDKKVPLIVPEVNAEVLKNYPNTQIIANPNCSTIPIAVALKSIDTQFDITRINIATYQSVSGAGKTGVRALAAETAALLNGQTPDSPILLRQIAFNVIPQIDVMTKNGYTAEEMKLVLEIQKILNKKIKINATAVRVPVFFGHSAVVSVETKSFPDVKKVKKLWKKTPGVTVVENDDFPTPVTHAANHDDIFIGRIRQDISHKNGLTFWVVTDNVRKGAALNAVQIAERLLQND